jgi:hypothetical protein
VALFVDALEAHAFAGAVILRTDHAALAGRIAREWGAVRILPTGASAAHVAACVRELLW